MVVIVEDFLISKLVRTVLQKKGYSTAVAGPAEAATLLRAHPDAGLLVTNCPGIFVEFARTVPLLYLTSSPDPLLKCFFRSCRVVCKPFAPEALVKAVEELEAMEG